MPIKLLFVCLGNICRSPIAEATFKEQVQARNLTAHFEADSAGIQGWHTGKPADARTIKNAAKHGIELTHSARKVVARDLDFYDNIVVMDEQNFEDIHTLFYQVKGTIPSADKLFLIRDFDPEVRGPHSVVDPFYEGEKVFEEVFQTVWRSNAALLDHLIDKYQIHV